MLLQNFKSLIYNLVKPSAEDEDSRRQEFILSTLLLGMVALAFMALVRVIFDEVRYTHAYHGMPPLLLLIPCAVFLALYGISRRRFYRLSAYVLLAIIAAFGFYSLYTWGIDLPAGLMALSLGIVMAGVLISTRFSLLYAGSLSLAVLVLGYFETQGLSHPLKNWINTSGGVGDAVTFVFILMVIAIVSWLSSNQLEKSLDRARTSEQALAEERDQLEQRVAERTRELQAAQQEKIMQLYRFADFGRISSGLLHDIINPLTAVSLNLEQLSTKKRSDLVQQAIEGIKYIEHFVQAARKQIQYQQEVKEFAPAAEVDVILGALASKIRAGQVTVKTTIDPKIRIYGSQLKFHQLITNLLSNAIDAYEDSQAAERMVEIAITETKQSHVITVKDHGHGIPEHQLAQIFEPFFTTKPVEKGTGIGLFIARRITEEDFFGDIKVTSRVGGGAAFTVTLPRHRG